MWRITPNVEVVPCANIISVLPPKYDIAILGILKLVPADNDIPLLAIVSCDDPQEKLILFEEPAEIASVPDALITDVFTLTNDTRRMLLIMLGHCMIEHLTYLI